MDFDHVTHRTHRGRGETIGIIRNFEDRRPPPTPSTNSEFKTHSFLYLLSKNTFFEMWKHILLDFPSRNTEESVLHPKHVSSSVSRCHGFSWFSVSVNYCLSSNDQVIFEFRCMDDGLPPVFTPVEFVRVPQTTLDRLRRLTETLSTVLEDEHFRRSWRTSTFETGSGCGCCRPVSHSRQEVRNFQTSGQLWLSYCMYITRIDVLTKIVRLRTPP